MFPRSSNFIYKPYCFLSSKIPLNQTSITRSSVNHTTTTTNSNSVSDTGLLLSSSSTQLAVPSLFLGDFLRDKQPICGGKVNYGVARKKENVPSEDWLKFCGGFHSLNAVYFYTPSIKMDDSMYDGSTCKSLYQYNRERFDVQLAARSNSFALYSTPANSNSKISIDKTKKDISNDNQKSDLPNEYQMDEMMYYFQEQANKLFSLKGWSYIKCSYKVIFENRLIGTQTETLNSYIMQINLMKNITKVILHNPKMSIVRMSKDLADGSIHVRWQVQGIPRFIKPLAFFGLVDERNSNRFIDGFSVFYMKNDGFYHKHVLMKMTPMRSEEFQTVFSQIFSNLMYRPTLRPSLETNNVSNDQPLK